MAGHAPDPGMEGMLLVMEMQVHYYGDTRAEDVLLDFDLPNRVAGRDVSIAIYFKSFAPNTCRC